MIDSACEHGARKQRDKDLGQTDLFGGDEHTPGSASMQLPDVAAWTEIEQLQFEKETLGLYWSGHPIDRFADDLRELGAKAIADLGLRKEAVEDIVAEPPPGTEVPAYRNGNGASAGDRRPGLQSRQVSEDVSIGGIVTGLRPLKTRKGDRMSVFTLEDKDGGIEIVVFPEAFKQYGHHGENGQLVLVKGTFERDDESARIIASEIMPIEQVRERLARSVAIRLSTPPHDRATFEKLWDVFARHKGDRRVIFDVEVNEPQRHLRMKVDVAAQIRVRPSERLVSDVEKICGVGSVSLR